MKATSEQQAPDPMELKATPNDSTGSLVLEQIQRNKLIERGILTYDQVKRYLALGNNKQERKSLEMFKVKLEATCSDFPECRLSRINKWEQEQIL
jgi:hypothetical protein